MLAVVVLVALVGLLALGTAIVWPRSRRWSRANRLHRLESRNELAGRTGARMALDEAVRALESARRDCVASGQDADEAGITHLLHQVGVVRDRLASDYTPTSANLPASRREPSLDYWTASQNVRQLCLDLARRARRQGVIAAPQVAAVEAAATELRDEVSSL